MYSNNIIQCIYEDVGDQAEGDTEDSFDDGFGSMFAALDDIQEDLYLKNQIMFIELTDEQKLEKYKIDISGIKPGEIKGDRLVKAFKLINATTPTIWRRNIQRDINAPISVKVGSYFLLKNVPAYAFDFKTALSNDFIPGYVKLELKQLNEVVKYKFEKAYFFQKLSTSYNIYLTGRTSEGMPIGYSKRHYISKALRRDVSTSTVYGPAGTTLLPNLTYKGNYYYVRDQLYRSNGGVRATQYELNMGIMKVINQRLKDLGLRNA